jgi:ketosteroid isomerase-like protein
VDPKVIYVIPGEATVSAAFCGVEQTIGAFRRLRQGSGGTIVVEPRLVLSDDNHVVFTGRVTAEHNGRHLDVTNAYLFRFRDGKLVEGRLFPGDLHAIEAFFGQAGNDKC